MAGGQAQGDVLTAANVLQLQFQFWGIVFFNFFIFFLRNQALTVNNKRGFHQFCF